MELQMWIKYLFPKFTVQNLGASYGQENMVMSQAVILWISLFQNFMYLSTHWGGGGGGGAPEKTLQIIWNILFIYIFIKNWKKFYKKK
jgi:hypothetical protein